MGAAPESVFTGLSASSPRPAGVAGGALPATGWGLSLAAVALLAPVLVLRRRRA